MGKLGKKLKLMIIIKINGGLGNQLFQYAVGKRLAEKHQIELKFDISEYTDGYYRKYRLGNFNIEGKIASKEEINQFKKNNWQKILEKIKPYYKRTTIKYSGYGFDKNILKLGANVYLDGYWQNEKYFLDISDIIKQKFTLKNALSPIAQDLQKKTLNCNSVSIHIRRGDYITSSKFSKIYKLLPWDYYANAIKKISIEVSSPIFFIFSDDIEWIKNNTAIPSPNIIVSRNELNDYEELFLMSSCRHNIIANSSFSWWGAWLNSNPNKIIIGPKAWFNFCDNDQGIMPESWLKIS